MSQMVACPHCRALLRSEKPIPPGINLRCPECRAPFSSGQVTKPSLFGPAFILAVAVSLLLGAAIIAAALVLTARQPEPVAQEPAEESADESIRDELADARAKLAARERRLRQMEREAEEARREARRSPVQDESPGQAEDKQVELLSEARAALDGESAEKKKQADYRQHMDAGKSAMRAERYTDAVKEYMAALRLMPDDLEAQQGQRQAEARLAALADKEKRQNAFDALTERAKTAQRGKRFKEAVQALEAALRLIPDDREAARDLRTAKADLARVKRENPSLLARADLAVKLRRLNDARDLCDEAVKNWAEDELAEKALKNVDRLIESAKMAQATYLARVQAAQLAYAAGNYAQAVAAFAEAARLMPADVVVARQLREARAAFERQKARYNRAIGDGQRALQMRRKSDAIAAFTAALDEMPVDLAATNGLRQARMMR
jgi:tetratricopeptide (TPR) repeat protein